MDQAGSAEKAIDHYTADAKAIRQAAGQCLKRVDLTRRLRLLGVRVGKLARAGSDEARAIASAPAEDGAEERNLALF